MGQRALSIRLSPRAVPAASNELDQKAQLELTLPQAGENATGENRVVKHSFCLAKKQKSSILKTEEAAAAIANAQRRASLVSTGWPAAGRRAQKKMEMLEK